MVFPSSFPFFSLSMRWMILYILSVWLSANIYVIDKGATTCNEYNSVYLYTRYGSVFQTIFLREKMKDIFTGRQSRGGRARGDRAQIGKPVAWPRVGVMTPKWHKTTYTIFIVKFSRVEGEKLNQWTDLQNMRGEIARVDSDEKLARFLSSFGQFSVKSFYLKWSRMDEITKKNMKSSEIVTLLDMHICKLREKKENWKSSWMDEI